MPHGKSSGLILGVRFLDRMRPDSRIRGPSPRLQRPYASRISCRALRSRKD